MGLDDLRKRLAGGVLSELPKADLTKPPPPRKKPDFAAALEKIKAMAPIDFAKVFMDAAWADPDKGLVVPPTPDALAEDFVDAFKFGVDMARAAPSEVAVSTRFVKRDLAGPTFSREYLGRFEEPAPRTVGPFGFRWPKCTVCRRQVEHAECEKNVFLDEYVYRFRCHGEVWGFSHTTDATRGASIDFPVELGEDL